MRNRSGVGAAGGSLPGRLLRVWLLVSLSLAAACGEDAPTPDDGGRTTTGAVTGPTATSETGPTGVSGRTGTGPTGATADGAAGSGATGATSGGDAEGNRASEDDLQVFAYATTDEAEVAAQLAAIVDTLAALEQAAADQDADAVRAAADELEAQARTLEQNSNGAADRQRPLEPRDGTLADARRSAIEAFGSTGALAGAALDLVEVATDPRPGFLEDVADLADTIEAEAEQATAAFEELNRLLAAWAEENPAQATRALAEYGG